MGADPATGRNCSRAPENLWIIGKLLIFQNPFCVNIGSSVTLGFPATKPGTSTHSIKIVASFFLPKGARTISSESTGDRKTPPFAIFFHSANSPPSPSRGRSTRNPGERQIPSLAFRLFVLERIYTGSVLATTCLRHF